MSKSSRKRDRAASIAFDKAAPRGERNAAHTELQKANLPVKADLLPMEPIQQMAQMIRDGLMDQYQDPLLKGGAQIIQFPGARARERRRGMQSVAVDQMQIMAMGDYYEKPGSIQFDQMRQMVEQTPIMNGIIMTRIKQIQRFCSPQEADDTPGFTIRHVDRAHKVTEDERREMQLLQRFITNCGWEFDPRARRRLKRDNFSQFIARAVRDSLTMDSMPIETEMKRDRRRGIDGFYAVDGGTIRLCSEQGYQGDDEIFALQVMQGRIATAYTYDDLIYEARNPRTDVALAGYGLSETELLVRVVTGFLNAMTLNIKGFSDNAIPQGIMTLIGDYTPQDLDAFKRLWNAMVRGVNNRWVLPILTAQDPASKATFEKIDAGFSEMYFAKWMTFLTSIACALHGMDPTEINFESFSASKSSMSGEDTSERLASAKDKGLRPTMSYLESTVSDFIMSSFGDKYVFRWAGMDDVDQQVKWERAKLTRTVDELRAEDDLPPLPGIGSAPVNPSLVGIWQQAQQSAQGQPPAKPGQAALDFGERDGGEGDDGKKDEGQGDSQGQQPFSKAIAPPPYRLSW